MVNIWAFTVRKEILNIVIINKLDYGLVDVFVSILWYLLLMKVVDKMKTIFSSGYASQTLWLTRYLQLHFVVERLCFLFVPYDNQAPLPEEPSQEMLLKARLYLWVS